MRGLLSREQWKRARVGKVNDRRIKLTDKDKAEIKEKYEDRKYNGERVYSYNSLAKIYGVSKRLIIFAVHPEKRVENYKLRVERGGSKQYYNKDAWRAVQKEHRGYIKKLVLEGKILDK